MNLDSRGTRGALLCVVGVVGAGCVMEAADSVAGAEHALGFAIAPYDPEPPAPPETPVPACWWVTGDEDCDARPRCQPSAPTEPPRPSPGLRVLKTSPPARRSAGSFAATPTRTRTSSSSTSLGYQANSCPLPNGIPACPTCEREGLHSSAFLLEVQLASRILVSNGGAAYVVKDFPSLNAAGGASDRISVDFAAEGSVMKSSPTGAVDFEQDLYMFFTGEFETGPYPKGRWMFCPAGGGTCVEVQP